MHHHFNSQNSSTLKMTLRSSIMSSSSRSCEICADWVKKCTQHKANQPQALKWISVARLGLLSCAGGGSLGRRLSFLVITGFTSLVSTSDNVTQFRSPKSTNLLHTSCHLHCLPLCFNFLLFIHQVMQQTLFQFNLLDLLMTKHSHEIDLNLQSYPQSIPSDLKFFLDGLLLLKIFSLHDTKLAITRGLL